MMLGRRLPFLFGKMYFQGLLFIAPKSCTCWYSRNIPLFTVVLYMSAGFHARFQPQSTGHVKTSRVFFSWEKKIQTKPTAAAPNQRRLFPNPDLSLPEIVQGLGSVGAFHEIRWRVGFWFLNWWRMLLTFLFFKKSCYLRDPRNTNEKNL